jgi:hypothetical protein
MTGMPTEIIAGYKNDINVSGDRITKKKTPIVKVVIVTVRSLGTGTYIAFGNEDEQPRRLLSVGATLDIDWIDDLSKVVVSTDVGSTGAVEFIGG